METNTIYTRTGKINSDRAPFRQYNFPIKAGSADTIRVTVPYTATKTDLAEAIEHMTIIAKHWVEE